MPRKPPPAGLGHQAQRAKAIVRAQTMVPRIKDLQAHGLNLEQIAGVMNEEGYRTARGSRWRAESIQRVLDLVAGTGPPKPQKSTLGPPAKD
jgi:Recombinase